MSVVVALRLVLLKPPTQVNDRPDEIACAERCILMIQMGEFPATFPSLLKKETVDRKLPYQLKCEWLNKTSHGVNNMTPSNRLDCDNRILADFEPLQCHTSLRVRILNLLFRGYLHKSMF